MRERKTLNTNICQKTVSYVASTRYMDVMEHGTMEQTLPGSVSDQERPFHIGTASPAS